MAVRARARARVGGCCCRWTMLGARLARRTMMTTATSTATTTNRTRTKTGTNGTNRPDMAAPRRRFHDYFVTHLPSSSLHPDQRPGGPHHHLPRAASTPHDAPAATSAGSSKHGHAVSAASAPAPAGLHLPRQPHPHHHRHHVPVTRELTVVRIPLRSAKHHFGAAVSRGQRPYNEDAYQAGTIAVPAFAKRAPISLSRASAGAASGTIGREQQQQQRDGKGVHDSAGETTSGRPPMPPRDPQPGGPQGADPQVFYFGVFDGHGGHECSDFLREELHAYLEHTAANFGLRSSLAKDERGGGVQAVEATPAQDGAASLKAIHVEGASAVRDRVADAMRTPGQQDKHDVKDDMAPVAQDSNRKRANIMERALMSQWKETVGGYFRRFRPAFFNLPASSIDDVPTTSTPVSIESVLMYSFLKADLDFLMAQTRKPDPDDHTDKPLNEDDVLGEPSYLSPSHTRIGGPERFLGGSTASIALISTPTPTPFWHPATPSTLLTAHVGDTRILLCTTATGLPRPMTTNHHPNTPSEGTRLRRYAATFVTDSFGEERMSGLANTRAFGDMRSKRVGVSAEPEIHRLELAPAEYSFLVLVSDGVSGTLSDQEVVDVVKEARTPEQGARDVIAYATEVTGEGDNATCLVVRLGGWERRSEGGMGSLGTKEMRDFRREEAADPRRARDLR